MSSLNISDFGKNFLVEPSSTQLTTEEMRLLEKLQPKAIMFRKRNFLQEVDYAIWLKEYQKLYNQIRQVIGHEKLMISVDHEGGRVIRPPDPITKFPYAATWGDAVGEVAYAMAMELKSLGINVNFAPVADIHTNPDNPVINERAFGRTAQDVSAAATLFAKTMQENGIAPCAKHFPGHGDTKVDSHFSVPVIDRTFTEMRERELVPFQALIDNNIQMVMTAHLMLPKIDPANQATLSKKILTDILRQEMNFKGVVIADALGMAAIVNLIQARENIAKAINAGLDIFLVAGDSISLADACRMAELLQEAFKKHEIPEITLIESHNRIDKFIDALPQHSIDALDANIFEHHHALADRLSKNAPWSNFHLSLPAFE